ncbi:hypothetical protein ACOYR1_11195 [Thalassotalea piscium]
MKYILPFVFVIVFFFSKTTLAEQPLTKAIAQQYFTAIKQVEQLQQKYPDLATTLDNYSFTDKEAFLSSIKEVPYFNEINQAIQNTGLKDVEQMYDLSIRILGGIMSAQMEQMPSGQNVEALLAMKDAAVAQMNKADMPEEMRKEMLKSLEEQEKNIKEMVKLSKNVSIEDKAFVKKNLNWIMQNMPEESEDD